MNVEPENHQLSLDNQMAQLGNNLWSVPRLINLSQDFKVMKVPLAHMDLSDELNTMTLRQMAGHMRRILNADLEKPIILSADGCIMDGRHRVMRCLVEGRKKVLAVRFYQNPEPCEIETND